MSRLSIVIYPHEILNCASTPVKNIDDQVVRLAQGMSRLMVASQGIGLAAPQVGISQRVITLNVGDGLISLINPVILECQGQTGREEGCLSCPGISVDVMRSEKTLVCGLNLDGKEVTIEAEGLKARVLQHEIDHLDGILILDKLPWLEKMVAKRKLRRR
ncbi:peptide deformylase [bacterium]|nr:peptide deformylase [bacterium]